MTHHILIGEGCLYTVRWVGTNQAQSLQCMPIVCTNWAWLCTINVYTKTQHAQFHIGHDWAWIPNFMPTGLGIQLGIVYWAYMIVLTMCIHCAYIIIPTVGLHWACINSTQFGHILGLIYSAQYGFTLGMFFSAQFGYTLGMKVYHCAL